MKLFKFLTHTSTSILKAISSSRIWLIVIATVIGSCLFLQTTIGLKCALWVTEKWTSTHFEDVEGSLWSENIRIKTIKNKWVTIEEIDVKAAWSILNPLRLQWDRIATKTMVLHLKNISYLNANPKENKKIILIQDAAFPHLKQDNIFDVQLNHLTARHHEKVNSIDFTHQNRIYHIALTYSEKCWDEIKNDPQSPHDLILLSTKDRIAFHKPNPINTIIDGDLNPETMQGHIHFSLKSSKHSINKFITVQTLNIHGKRTKAKPIELKIDLQANVHQQPFNTFMHLTQDHNGNIEFDNDVLIGHQHIHFKGDRLNNLWKIRSKWDEHQGIAFKGGIQINGPPNGLITDIDLQRFSIKIDSLLLSNVHIQGSLNHGTKQIDLSIASAFLKENLAQLTLSGTLDHVVWNIHGQNTHTAYLLNGSIQPEKITLLDVKISKKEDEITLLSPFVIRRSNNAWTGKNLILTDQKNGTLIASGKIDQQLHWKVSTTFKNWGTRITLPEKKSLTIFEDFTSILNGSVDLTGEGLHLNTHKTDVHVKHLKGGIYNIAADSPIPINLIILDGHLDYTLQSNGLPFFTGAIETNYGTIPITGGQSLNSQGVHTFLKSEVVNMLHSKTKHSDLYFHPKIELVFVNDVLQKLNIDLHIQSGMIDFVIPNTTPTISSDVIYEPAFRHTTSSPHVNLNLTIEPKQVEFHFLGFEGWLKGALAIKSHNETTTVNGQLNLDNASFSLFERQSPLKTVQVNYYHSSWDQAYLTIEAEKVESLTQTLARSSLQNIGMSITGLWENPRVHLYSNPDHLSNMDIITLLFHKKTKANPNRDAEFLSLMQKQGLSMEVFELFNIISQTEKKFFIDSMQFNPNWLEHGDFKNTLETDITFNKRIVPNINLQYQMAVEDESKRKMALNIELSKRMYLRWLQSLNEGSSLELIYSSH